MRQGCPLPALLFILAAEVPPIKIRNDLEITGITLFDSVEIKILQFADDATIFVKDTKSLKKAIEQIEHFGLFSGLELNKSKSSIANVNGDTIGESIYGIPWTYSDVKILKVQFGKNEQNLIDLNWKPKISKIENTVRLWRARRLTFSGKITIIKSFLVSQIIYNAQMISMPENVMKHIDSLLYTFL